MKIISKVSRLALNGNRQILLFVLTILLSANLLAQRDMGQYTGEYECVQKKVWTNNDDTTHYFSWDTVTVYVSEHETNPIRLIFVDSTFLNDSTIYYPYDYYEVTVADTLTNYLFPWILHGGWGWFYPEYDSLQLYITAGIGQWGSKSWYYWGNKIITSVPEQGMLEVDVYPNPAQGYVAFRYELYKGANNGLIEIRNTTGKLVYQVKLNNRKGKTVWKIEDADPGLYFYTLKTNAGIKTGKIVVTR